MHRCFIVSSRLLLLVLVSAGIITACGPSVQATAIPSPTPMPTSTPLPEIDLDIELPEGDPESGYLTAIRYSCHGCHVNESHPTSGPRFAADEEMPFVLERGTMRIALPEYEGKATTDWEYMIESIFIPEAYIVPSEWEKPMPTHYHLTMTDQELADILAWIATLK